MAEVYLSPMPRLIRRLWEADPAALGARRDRASFWFEAHVPDLLAEATFHLDAADAALVADAERAVIDLNVDPPVLASLEAVARRLLRTESVASSRIEGIVLSQRRLAKAEAGGRDGLDETASSVLANVRAMEGAIALGASPEPWSVDRLVSLHQLLMENGPQADIAGRVRERQNWVGGSAVSPRGAEFIPPSADFVPGLLDDLVQFLARDDLSPVLQAAIAHAQFETIHPFADGNGRVGRALIHAVLRRRRLAERYVPPVSLVLAAHANDYVRGLTAFRHERLGEWVVVFADAILRAAGHARRLAGELAALQAQWEEAAGHPRRDSTAAEVLRLLPAHPLVTGRTLQALTGRSKQAVNEALARLEEAAVVRQTSVGKRHRMWEATGLFDLVNGFERSVG
jgi:Fic family protein